MRFDLDIKRINGLDLARIAFYSDVNYSMADLRPASTLGSGDELVISGYASDAPGQLVQVSTTLIANEASISLTGRNLLCDLRTANGMSGGPILSADGSLVGVDRGRTFYVDLDSGDGSLGSTTNLRRFSRGVTVDSSLADLENGYKPKGGPYVTAFCRSTGMLAVYIDRANKLQSPTFIGYGPFLSHLVSERGQAVGGSEFFTQEASSLSIPIRTTSNSTKNLVKWNLLAWFQCKTRPTTLCLMQLSRGLALPRSVYALIISQCSSVAPSMGISSSE
jgi:hypothetical protein